MTEKPVQDLTLDQLLERTRRDLADRERADREDALARRRPSRPRAIMVRTFGLGLLTAAIVVGGYRLARGEELPVRQLWVIDGDTIDVLVPKKEPVRLQGIDAPETHQPHCEAEKQKGLEAKRAVIALVRAGRTASVTRAGQDRYGRTLGDIAIDGQDIGRFLITRGLALPYRPGPDAKAQRIAHWCGPGNW